MVKADSRISGYEMLIPRFGWRASMDCRGELKSAPTKESWLVVWPVTPSLIKMPQIVIARWELIDICIRVHSFVQYEPNGVRAQTLVIIKIHN